MPFERDDGARVPRLVLWAALLAVSGCECGGGEPATGTGSTPIGGWYRAEIRAEGGEAVPFYLSLPADPETASARIVTGEQELVARHAWRGTEATVEFPLFGTRLRAEAGADGALSGSFRHESLAFGDSELALSAERVSEPDPEARFQASEEQPGAELDARWRLRVGSTGAAQLTLAPRGPTAVGAVLKLENGNVVYLAGNRRDDELALSGFDGSSPYLLEATVEGDEIEGEWLAGPGLGWREPVTGEADPDVRIDAGVALAPSTYRLSVPELAEPPYEDSPVVVALTGSWSPASMRAVPFLEALRDEHADAGLEILALNYELTSDEAHNDAAAGAIAEAHQVSYDIVPVDGAPEEFASTLPVGLQHIDVQSFPILVFVDREGLIRAARAGFPPAAAAELHGRATREYRELAAEIAAAGE